LVGTRKGAGAGEGDLVRAILGETAGAGERAGERLVAGLVDGEVGGGRDCDDRAGQSGEGSHCVTEAVEIERAESADAQAGAIRERVARGEADGSGVEESLRVCVIGSEGEDAGAVLDQDAAGAGDGASERGVECTVDREKDISERDCVECEGACEGVPCLVEGHRDIGSERLGLRVVVDNAAADRQALWAEDVEKA